ncbi:DUF3035 domain-containing protein [Caulobacter mirabilis]|uniref:Beta-barrel assembly machine subunit BamF n=1 Tax=Caulobacter mirabilis TaxID=69666 RepID=A0A2D2B203_9CAUL|nr:DUF3035 domain-containing protein [Caulobacter mirabilis]ATQ44302.1 beta-barrel assembly machine subunit BamF [Caulobacter mirabilis]
MISSRVLCVLALTAAAGLGGCQSAAKALGVAKVTPDEFRVVTKAPLVLPPDYSLRPPAPGEPRPQELQPESAARAALIGQSAAAQRSDGERLLAARSGAEKSDPLIRYVVDDEFGDIAHKDKSFADRVMFWRKDQPTAPAPAADGTSAPAPVDAAAEEARLKGVTGGKPVVIAREKSNWVKLPGL